MKKIIFTVLLMILPIMGFAGNGKETIPKNKLLTLISEYHGKDGFEIVKIGSFGTSLLKTALKLSVSKEKDEETEQALRLMKGVKKIAVVEYESADKKSRDEFNTRLEKILSSADMLMEAKEDNETVRIYGVINEDGSEVQDFLVHVPEDGALACLFGSLPFDEISQIISQQ